MTLTQLIEMDLMAQDVGLHAQQTIDWSLDLVFQGDLHREYHLDQRVFLIWSSSSVFDGIFSRCKVGGNCIL
jgi:hypothetical protein